MRKASRKQQTRKGKVRIINILNLFPDLETEAIFENTSLICLMQNPPLLDTSGVFSQLFQWSSKEACNVILDQGRKNC